MSQYHLEQSATELAESVIDESPGGLVHRRLEPRPQEAVNKIGKWRLFPPEQE